MTEREPIQIYCNEAGGRAIVDLVDPITGRFCSGVCDTLQDLESLIAEFRSITGWATT